MEHILLSHGSGSKNSQELLSFISQCLEDCLESYGEDSGIVDALGGRIAITTDSYTIDPIFFPGGDIGKLAVCGTLNDLAMVGAQAQYITLSLIIEENFTFEELDKILSSIRKESKKNKVKIIAGDTKVVNKGKLDKIFINTAGYGVVSHKQRISVTNAQPGDAVIVTGDIGAHGATIMALRNNFDTDLVSDCDAVWPLIYALLKADIDIHTLRDPTRGGLASILNEIALSSNIDIELIEEDIPIRQSVQGLCDTLGIDPLYMACEGRAVVICPEKHANLACEVLHGLEQGKNAKRIGTVLPASTTHRVYLKTFIGSRIILPLLTRELTPRIC
jgi:hydrogenase expression/formation protein HypE